MTDNELDGLKARIAVADTLRQDIYRLERILEAVQDAHHLAVVAITPESGRVLAPHDMCLMFQPETEGEISEYRLAVTKMIKNKLRVLKTRFETL